MIISHKRSFVFIHIPKNGGTMFRTLISGYHDDPREFWWVRNTDYLNLSVDHGHLKSWEIRIFYPDVWRLLKSSRTLCFFRDPAERFVSAIYEHFRLFRPEGDLQNHSWLDQQRLAREFTFALNLQEVFWNPLLVHFSPQTWFTHLNGRLVVKEIIPLIEGFDAFRAAALSLGLPDIGPAPKTAPNRDPVAFLGDAAIQRVRDIYRDDYAFCRSQAHLSALAGP